MISIKGMEKRYGEVRAVSDISFDISRGEIVGLLGHNGAGKTTIMKVLTGFLEPTSGTVTVDGADIREDRIGVQRRIGYLPENAPLYPEMLVQEYLQMMAELREIPQQEQRRAIVRAIKVTGLEDWILRPISTLSKGYRQRVGLAQALLHEPDVLVLDEPTNGLDPVQIVEVRELIKRLGQKITVIFSTHILSEIEALCDRVVILIDGKLAMDAPLKQLLGSPSVKLSLGEEDPEEVLPLLEPLPGVKSARRIGKTQSYRVLCVGEANPIPGILKVAAKKGWEVQSAALERANLESVFQELMDQHVSQARKEVG